METKTITVLFSKHSVMRLKQRMPSGHGLVKGAFIRLMLVREQDRKRKAQWLLRIPNGVLLGRLRQEKKKGNRDVLIVRTALDSLMLYKQQRQNRRQFIPLEVKLFQIGAIGTTYKPEKRMPTMREQVSELLRNNPEADYWEKLVVRLAEALLAEVDEQLRGIPVEEAGIEKWTFEDFMNLPEGSIELHDGIPSHKSWMLAVAGERRRGNQSIGEEAEDISGKSAEELEALWAEERAALRAKPFVPSQVPFPSGLPGKD
jgi:hypothetical protein